MINVWILGNKFANMENIENYYQYSMLASEFKKHDCIVKFIDTSNLIIRNNSNYLEYEGELLEAPDAALLKTFLTGDYWKDKMKKLQSLGTFILNNSDNTIDYSDKIKMYQRLESANIPIPKTIGLDIKMHIDNVIKATEEKIGWPCVIKPNYGWVAGGLFTCMNANDLRHAITNMELSMDTIMGKSRPKPTSFVIQELVNAKYILVFSGTRDKFYTTMVYGKNSLLHKTAYKNSPLLSVFEKCSMTIQHKPSNEAIDIFTSTLDALGLDIVRAEIFVTDDGYKVCEFNSTIGGIGIPSIVCRENVAKDIVEYFMRKYWASTTLA